MSHFVASSTLLKARVSKLSPDEDWFMIGGTCAPGGKRNANRLTPAAAYRVEIFFTRHGCTSELGLCRNCSTSTRMPRAFLSSTRPANRSSSDLKSSSFIEAVASFQSILMTRVLPSHETWKKVSSCIFCMYILRQ